ncbi:hypothetical protein Pmani_034184, partial [Petrolisthes manimaculis]
MSTRVPDRRVPGGVKVPGERVTVPGGEGRGSGCQGVRGEGHSASGERGEGQGARG